MPAGAGFLGSPKPGFHIPKEHMKPFLEVENGQLVNLSTITDVEFRDTKQTADLRCHGIIIVGDSRIAWRFFKGDEGRNITQTLAPEVIQET